MGQCKSEGSKAGCRRSSGSSEEEEGEKPVGADRSFDG